MNTETKILELVAMDRIEIPISSLSGKLKRLKPKVAGAVDLGKEREYQGERCYARLETEENEKARTLREGIDIFSQQHPRYGAILEGIIAETRIEKETSLYFGMNGGCRLTEADYIGVMKSLGFTETGAKNLYPELMEVSRNLSRKRGEERSILMG